MKMKKLLAYLLAIVLTLGIVPLADLNVKTEAASGFQWPMSGYWVTQDFGEYSTSMANNYGRPYHSGIDIKSNNTNVYPTADGTVVYKGYSNGNGNHVIIEHKFNNSTIKSLYSHLANFANCPNIGQGVTKDTIIGIMGNTGNSTGPHLHFGFFTGSSTDPVGYTSTKGENYVTHGSCTYYKPSYIINNGTQPQPPSVNFTQDTKYPVPITVYPKATSGLITVYNESLVAYSTSTRNIAYNDLCTINAVYTNGYCKVTYPTSNGRSHTEYAKWSDFADGSVTPYSWSPSSNTNAYTRSNMSEVFGSVFSTDSCTVVGKSGDNLQVIYPITGGYKMGWVNSTSTTVTPEPERQPTFSAGDLVALEGKSIVAVAPNKITISTSPVKYISQGDICILKNFNSSTGYCDVTYPSGSSDVFAASNTVTVNISITNFISYNSSSISEKAKIPEKLTMYPTQAMSNTVANTTTNWWLDAKDEYTTINCVDGKTELLYYCTQGKHTGYWKLGWAYLDYYWIDLNGYLDNASQGGLMSYGTADIYVNGVKRANDVTDFYSANGTYPRGSTYEIKDIRPYKGYTYNGVQSGEVSGELKSNTSVSLNFTKNPVTVAGIVVTTNPTKTTYLEGESLNTSGLVVTANYSDGTNKNVTASCSFSGYDKNAPGTQTVKVTYSGKTTSFTVNVKSKSPTKIDITSMPSKTSYCIGEAVNLTGLAVKATYDNNTSATVADYDYYYDHDITDSAGTKTITVSYTYNGVTKSTSFNITVQAHSYTSKVTKDPTCTATGVRTYTCSKCSHSYTETISPAGHKWTAATCSTPKTCSVCKITEGSPNTHSYTSKVTTAATCENSGVRTYTCSKCSHSYTESIAPTGHSFGSWTTTTSATCTAAGKQTRTCSVCKKSETKDIAALGHNFSTSYTVDTPATCTTAGSKSQHCTRCTAKQNVTSIPATGHSYTSTVTTAATCEKAGVKTFTCSKCSHSYTESIAATGHSFGSWTTTTSATCTAAGKQTRTCSVCKKSETKDIAALGHNFSTSYTVDKAATCTTAGEKSQHCTRCTATQNKTTISPTGHNYVGEICSYCKEPKPKPVDATVTVSSASATAGNQVKVSVSLKNNPGITSMLLKVNFDTTKLQLISVEDCENLGTAFHSNSMNSPFTLSWANDTATTNYTYNGDIVVFTFKIKDGAALGSTPITITYDYDNYDIIDKDMNPVEFNVVNGSVNIIDVIIGDVNNDGKVNQLDRVVLTRYLANWAEYPEGSINAVAADVNADGKVNQLDRVVLTRHLANWSGYESLPFNN